MHWEPVFLWTMNHLCTQTCKKYQPVADSLLVRGSLTNMAGVMRPGHSHTAEKAGPCQYGIRLNMHEG